MCFDQSRFTLCRYISLFFQKNREVIWYLVELNDISKVKLTPASSTMKERFLTWRSFTPSLATEIWR